MENRYLYVFVDCSYEVGFDSIIAIESTMAELNEAIVKYCFVNDVSTESFYIKAIDLKTKKLVELKEIKND